METLEAPNYCDRKGYDGMYRLVKKDGIPITIPYEYTDGNEEACEVTGGTAPHKPSSEGFILKGSGFNSKEFYAGTADLKWQKLPE